MFAHSPFPQATWDKMASIADALALGIERKFAAEELGALHSQLHRLLALSPAVLYNLRIEGRNVVPAFVTGNIERILGIPVAEANSYEWWIRSLHPEDRDRMLASMGDVLTQGGFTAEYRLRHHDGNYRWILDSNRVVRDAAGEPREIAGVWTEVSEHKREEALRRRLEATAADAQAANRAKSTFLSAMSHEMRTPMNAILGYTQLMLRDPGLGADAKANLTVIGRSGKHLLALINDVLDMSGVEAGRTEFNPVTFHLPSLLEDLAVMFRVQAEEKSLRFGMAVVGEAIPYVVADEGKVRQVLINLLENAVKFTQRGYVLLNVSVEQRRDDVLWLSARAEDTGSGIADDEQIKLFQPFSQTRLGLTGVEGTGLGLAISRKFACLMGGDITFTSQAGSGSAFRFEIPILRGDASVAVKRIVPRHVIGIRTGTEVPGILIVDDHLENRDWLMKLLGLIGFRVRSANNGEAAIRVWEEWKPGLILMDVHMPVMDGLEATRRIKGDARGRETIIVALTASAMDADRRTAAESGADDFIGKPCQEDELLEKIGTLLSLAYDYEEGTGGKDHEPAAATLNADRFCRLPLKLVEELRKATRSGNQRLLNQLISEVGDLEDYGSAHALKELADKYQYDALTRVLEEACHR